MESAETRKRPAEDEQAEDSAPVAKRARVSGTCEWILEEDAFRKWRQATIAQNSILWVHGPAGSGKTFLAQHVIDVLEQSTNDPPTAGCMCETTSSPLSIASSILSQLSQSLKIEPTGLEAVQIASRDLQSEQQTVPYTSDAAWDVLENTLQNLPVCNLIIDGLDELSSDYLSDASFNVAKRLESMVLNRPGSLRLYASSRTVTSIRDVFGVYQEIALTSDKTEADMRRFIVDEIQQFPYLSSNQDLVTDKLTQDAEGIFVWANLGIQYLATLDDTEDIQLSLDSIPTTLDSLYSALVMKQFTNQSPLEIRMRNTILAWVLNSVRPLSLYEVGNALDAYDNIYVADIENRIIQLCGSLLKIEGGFVKPMHHSLRDFFRSSDSSLSATNIIQGSAAHTLIAFACLRYLSHDAFKDDFTATPDTESLVSNYHLLEYASLYWVYHFCKADAPQRDLEAHVTRLFDSYNVFNWADRFLSIFLPKSVLGVPPRPTSSAKIAYLYQLRSQIIGGLTRYPELKSTLDQSTSSSLVHRYESAQTQAQNIANVDPVPSIRRTLDLGEVYGWTPGRKLDSESQFNSAIDQITIQNLITSPSPESRSLALSVYQAKADSLKRAGAYEDAVSLLDSLLQRLSEQPQPLPRHLETNRSFALDALGWTCMRLGRLDDAATHLTAALASTVRIHGSTSPATQRTKITLAETLSKLNRGAEAEILCTELVSALHRHRDARTELPADYVSALNVLASVYSVQGKTREAVDAYDTLVEYRRRGYGSEHPITLWAEMQLGLARERLVATEAERAELLAYFEELVTRQERVLGEHPDVRTSEGALARLRG